jgi:hypothetical protein
MEPQRQHREIEITGPDDVQLVIRPAPNRFSLGILSDSGVRPATDYQLWSIHNGALRSLPEIQLEISSAQSFDDKKSAFREPVNLGFQWPSIGNVGAGAWTEPDIFLRVDGDHIRLSDKTAVLPWPNGDETRIRCWRLNMRVIGLSKDWPIEIDVRWTLGTQIIELMKYASDTAPGEPARKSRGRKSRFSKQQLEKARQMKAAKKTNNEIAKVLYGPNPTDAQRRSVPTTLKHHFGQKTGSKNGLEN